MIEEKSPRKRIARLIRMLITRPFSYTMKELADRLERSIGTIKGDFNILKSAGFELKFDENYRYGFETEGGFQHLKDLLHFTEKDKQFLWEAIRNYELGGTKRGERVEKKLHSLYDYNRLGFEFLRRPHLAKIDLLEQAKKEEKIVILKDYHSSNSNVITDRYVEPFHLNPSEDSLHTFDTRKGELRHFLISRFKRVELTNEPWNNKGKHNIRATDAFFIVNNEQVLVHLRLQVAAYNELIEKYPNAKKDVVESEEKNIYDFQSKVNREFLGLTNFILGYYDMIEVLSPNALMQHLQKEIKKIQEKFGGG